MPNGTVHLDVVDAIATVTLARPERLNAMSVDLMCDLLAAIETAVGNRAVRVLVLTGSGRGFCSGADLIDPDLGDVSESMDTIFHPVMRALIESPIPTVARVNGVAAGGGVGLALACDITIAARSASFVATFGPRLGIVPDLGTTWSLPRRVGRARALGMAILGDRIDASQAEEWGLVFRTVDDAGLDDEVARVTSALSRTSAEAVVRIRESIDSSTDNTFSEQLDLERDHQVVLIPMNMGEGVKAFTEKREPDFGERRS